jgi:hypothetical protein
MKCVFRLLLICVLISFGLVNYSLYPAPSSKKSLFKTQNLSDKELQVTITKAKKLYENKFREVQPYINKLFGINFLEYKQNYQAQIEQLTSKISLIEEIPDSQEKERLFRMLKKEYEDKELFRYLEVHLYLQNEIAKDHLFAGKYLAELERIVEEVIQKDNLFRYVFNSKEFQNRNGLILTRVVWQISASRNVSMDTQPLNLHAVFADKSKTPVLIRITPLAFHSLAFLRSLLIHELNHAYMFRDPIFSNVERFSGEAIAPAKGKFTHYFKILNPTSPSYQYYLIHEYYGLKAQLMFDGIVEEEPFYKLDEKNKKNIEEMLTWVYSQLNVRNKKFVESNPTPSVFNLIRRFWIM